MGAILVYIRQSGSAWLLPARVLIITYVEVFRRIPFLVILFIVLFAIQAVSKTASLFMIATIAICLLSTAFLSEIIRAGFESVPRLQTDAAAGMNFSRFQTVRYVVVPQSWRVVVPPAVNYAVMFIKDSALAGQMGVFELTFVAKVFDARGMSAWLAFGSVLTCYFALSYPLGRLGAWLEVKLASRDTRPDLRVRAIPGPA
jgi:polar amino acid transport system permease protein